MIFCGIEIGLLGKEVFRNKNSHCHFKVQYCAIILGWKDSQVRRLFFGKWWIRFLGISMLFLQLSEMSGNLKVNNQFDNFSEEVHESGTQWNIRKKMFSFNNPQKVFWYYCTQFSLFMTINRSFSRISQKLTNNSIKISPIHEWHNLRMILLHS